MTQATGAAPIHPKAIDPEAYQIASTSRRVVAWLGDMMLLLVVASVVALVLGGWHSTTRTMTNDDGSTWTASTYYLDAVWSYSLMAIFSALAIPMWRIGGATPVQRLFGLRVYYAAEPKLLSWPRAGTRWLVLYGWTLAGIALAFIVPAIPVLVFWILALFVDTVRHDGDQGLHDRLARSLVVAPRRGLQSAWQEWERAASRPRPDQPSLIS